VKATDHSVIVVGAGPTGLMLAGELALAGVDVAIVERRPDQAVAGMRARGVHARTIELFEQRGIAERFLAQGQVFPSVAFAWIRLSIGDLPSRHPYGLALPQNDVERILAEWVEALGARIHRGIEVAGFTQDEAGCTLRTSDGGSLRAAYLVGCDGGRSLIRKAAGIAFPGSEPTLSNLIAEARMREEPEFGLRHDALGVHALSREEAGTIRILVTEPDLARTGEATLSDLSRALNAAYGSDFGVHSPVTISRFTDAARQAAAYRQGRVLLAGDAAHVHYPAGGLGLNLGLQDAVNLGWKLARVVKGLSPERLLDSYHDEQHAVAAKVLRNVMAQVALLGRLDDRKAALRQVLAELLALDEPRRRFGAMMSGLDIHYDLGPGHALLGRRMPDLDLVTEAGETRLSTLLHPARPILLNLAAPGRLDVGAWRDQVVMVDAGHDGGWELPAIGSVSAPTAVLIRPDGHVAWVEEESPQGLEEALLSWLGNCPPGG
jgi:2-polyprenyl-6-methoxyphenol hydroxylase-like FAD-dependent oxidoreductase